MLLGPPGQDGAPRDQANSLPVSPESQGDLKVICCPGPGRDQRVSSQDVVFRVGLLAERPPGFLAEAQREEAKLVWDGESSVYRHKTHLATCGTP